MLKLKLWALHALVRVLLSLQEFLCIQYLDMGIRRVQSIYLIPGTANSEKEPEGQLAAL